MFIKDKQQCVYCLVNHLRLVILPLPCVNENPAVTAFQALQKKYVSGNHL